MTSPTSPSTGGSPGGRAVGAPSPAPARTAGTGGAAIPAPDADPLGVLRARLQELYRYRGKPSYRALARQIGTMSQTTAHTVITCRKLPRWGNLELVVEALGGEADLVEEFRTLWLRADQAAETGWTPSATAISEFAADDRHVRRWLDVIPIAEELERVGEYRMARMLQERTLDAFLDYLGPEHPDTLTARHDLARCTGLAGDAAAARDQFTELLPIRERVLGPEHPDTLDTRADLSYWRRGRR